MEGREVYHRNSLALISSVVLSSEERSRHIGAPYEQVGVNWVQSGKCCMAGEGPQTLLSREACRLQRMVRSPKTPLLQRLSPTLDDCR